MNARGWCHSKNITKIVDIAQYLVNTNAHINIAAEVACPSDCKPINPCPDRQLSYITPKFRNAGHNKHLGNGMLVISKDDYRCLSNE